MKGLAEANKAVTEAFSAEQKIRIRAELVKVGVTTNPKPPQSLSAADSEASEETF